MKRVFFSALVAVGLFLAIPMMAQTPRGGEPPQTTRLSPHETISQVFDRARNNRVTITYGRPYSKKPGTDEIRKIWGTLVPWAQPWRMGADEATTLICMQPLQIGDTTIPAGAYTLYMLPQESGTSQMVFSTAIGGWGIPVDTKHDLAKVDLKKEDMDKQLDQYTMAVDANPAGGGIIKLMWEKTQYSVAFTIKK